MATPREFSEKYILSDNSILIYYSAQDTHGTNIMNYTHTDNDNKKHLYPDGGYKGWPQELKDLAKKENITLFW